ncbi:MAG: S46 family peptidase [Bdellovibrionales bacterium]|nr:S46 family peptidase [Bdellovibrionales bacterium]NQZ19086.1 S46 family peptidase [Bdellovibrionales bacterium]
MKSLLIVISLILSATVAHSDEGMWTVDNLPKSLLKKDYNFTPSDQWLKKVQLSSVRLGNGCSGSFVSKSGLVMTNHHCARGCIQQLSTAKNDLIAKGFNAKSNKQERQCPGLEINRLLEIVDVTDKIKGATKGLEGKAYSEARKAKMAELEKECSKGNDKLRCDTVTLYHGGEYKLYKYQRYQDVRLVFAPEQAIAHFGGDPDNFNFPRYSFDVTFLRVYEDKKPLDNKNFFKWTQKNIAPGEMTFITGHPGRTNRLLTVSELEFQRDVVLPGNIALYSEMRGLLTQYQKKGKEFKRTSHQNLQGVENRLKAYKGRVKALRDEAFFAQLVKKEKDLKNRVMGRRWYKKKYGKAWGEIDKAVELTKNHRDEINSIAYNRFQSRLFGIAQTLVRAGDELTKPNAKRLTEYTDSKVPQMKQRLLSKAPIYKDLEKTLMEFAFVKLRETLSPDHPFVKQVLGRKSPQQLAKELVNGTQLTKTSMREKLLKGGSKAIKASKDPMIRFALALDAVMRDKRKFYEENIEAVADKNSEKIAQAKFDIYGTDTYPDATFSLRVSYGKVKGYEEKGKKIYPLTKVAGIYKRQTGSYPFALPKSWERARKTLDGEVPFNFVSTNDIIGGNSGSPVINRNAEIVGLVFDGNIHSLGGAYGFDESVNRSVSVHSSVMLNSLDKVYNAKTVLSEIKESL